MAFISANNTKYKFKNYKPEYRQTTRKLFDGKTIYRVEFKH